ncbi:hypothetical protein CC2G_005162 [Coprinopsis cinerea AmutBmut pab1-1]|nr:hypothetical protein CC2G_005162 [Coprinopsis cinerea AmutBmut pab1-1]
MDLVADVPQHLPQLVMPYNITLNLTTLFSFLPSRLFARSKLVQQIWRRWDQAVEMGMASETASVGDFLGGDDESWPSTLLEVAAAAVASPTPAPKPAPPIAYPGPWAFFISGYMLGIFLMAVILHRIQNIIIPSRMQNRRGLRNGVSIGWNRRFSIFSRLTSSIFPLDLTQTSTRLAVHLPTLYYLCKMLTIWFVLVLQTSELYPEKGRLGWADSLGEMVRKMDMQDICWNTFVAVCVGFSVEGFVKALDGVEAGFPIGGNMNPNTSPFNIVGYAFLLHLYSSPFAHSQKSGDYPSRPDKHAIITVAIPLLQLTLFHALSVYRPWSSHRLFPTALSSFLSLIHFHGALWSYIRKSQQSSNPPFSSSEDNNPRILATYPILNYIPNLFETLLLITIFLTIVLNVVVQMVVRGRVERVFSGLGVSPIHNDDDTPGVAPGTGSGIRAFFRNLPYEEDFGVLLLRVGTASLEATGLRGWSNEVAPIASPVRRRKRRHRGLHPPTPGQVEYGSVRVGRVAAGTVQPGYKTVVKPSTSTRRKSKLRQQRLKGLRNEVRNVDLGLSNITPEARRSVRSFWRWLKEFGRYAEAVWAAAKGLAALSWRWILYLARGRRDREKDDVLIRRRRRVRGLMSDMDASNASYGSGDEDDETTSTEDSGERDKVVYERFLRGESISDDEDDDAEFVLEDDEEGEGEGEESPAEGDATPTAEEDPEREAFGLFMDLMRGGMGAGSSSSRGGEVVLAHMVNQNSSPLTRRRWEESQLVTSSWVDEDDDDEDDSMDAYGSGSGSGSVKDEDSSRTLCVVCTTDIRDIICWPCRCLAMCDGCREALASRSAPTKHRCPCCRQLIEGYSRIYIP